MKVLIRSQDDLFRYCTFLPSKIEDAILPNGTYIGPVGDVISFKSDMVIRPQNMFIDPDLVDLSNVAASDE